MTHAFEHLRELTLLDDAGLRHRFGPHAIRLLVVCSRLLRTQPITGDALTPESFAVEVKQLYAEYVAGTRALNEAMGRCADAVNRSDLAAARGVLHDFLASCSAPFYRDIAMARLESLGSK
jgi:hypothetical protein